MSERLDEVIKKLAAAPNERGLEGLDVDIARSLRARRQDSVLGSTRLASIGLALATGVMVGGIAATTAITERPFATFSAGSRLAPSTLLESDR